MINQIKKLTILLFYISVSYSFLKSNIPHKIIRRDISSFNSNIYDDVSSDVFNKKNFFKNEISCYAINFSPDNLKLCKNCKNFIPNDIFKFKHNNINITTDIPSKIIENININSGFCNKFSITNRINGDEQKILAFVCRANERFCGNHAKYYEE
jgi:hypothetical protein